MNTTALIIEMVVVGYTALTWITLLLLAILNKDIFTLLNQMKSYKELSPVFAIVITSFAYQIGWLLDYLSYRGFYYTWSSVLKISKGDDDKESKKEGIARKWKRAIIKEGDFWKEYIAVCKYCPAPVHSELNTDLSIVRFTRCGIINFIFLTLALVLYFFRFVAVPISIYFSIAIFIIGFTIIILCFNTMQNRWIHWYTKIHEAYLQN